MQEVSEDEEELFAMFEEDSKPKPQINTSVSDDEISSKSFGLREKSEVMGFFVF